MTDWSYFEIMVLYIASSLRRRSAKRCVAGGGEIEEECNILFKKDAWTHDVESIYVYIAGYDDRSIFVSGSPIVKIGRTAAVSFYLPLPLVEGNHHHHQRCVSNYHSSPSAPASLTPNPQLPSHPSSGLTKSALKPSTSPPQQKKRALNQHEISWSRFSTLPPPSTPRPTPSQQPSTRAMPPTSKAVMVCRLEPSEECLPKPTSTHRYSTLPRPKTIPKTARLKDIPMLFSSQVAIATADWTTLPPSPTSPAEATS